uniref:Uncharacterized protein n=1 Tax=Rhizophora mucronata TaxID=61149 RepID=A0A2P2QGP6_RHIMU
MSIQKFCTFALDKD